MPYSESDLAKMLRTNPDLVLVTDGNYTTVQPKPARHQNEEEFHKAVIAQCAERAEHDERYRWIFHPANGEFRHKGTAGRLKAMGVRKGVLDLYLIYRNAQGYAGWACELKSGRNQPTPEQQAEMEHLEAQGWKVECVWDDVQAVMDSLSNYLEGRKDDPQD